MTDHPSPKGESVRVKVFGSEEVAKLWSTALIALHAFAQESGCPIGGDVIKWFGDQTEAYAAARRAAAQAALQQGERS